jgi:hypothetical protein
MANSNEPATVHALDAIEMQFVLQNQGHDCIHIFHYNTAQANPGILEAYCYTDRISYRPGDVVQIHASSTAAKVDFAIYRDGVKQETVASFAQVPTTSHPAPENFQEVGCGWPIALRWRIPANARSGFYIIRITASRNGRMVAQEHGFCVRPAVGSPRAPVLFLLSTCTWTAYNDWGGINNYVGAKPPQGFHFGPRLSLHRPYSRGLIWLPRGAPRIVDELVPSIGDTPRYQSYEWAYAKGFCKFFAGAGWATYERNFAVWAEREGLEVDYVTQHDLDQDPAALEGYRCLVIVGHCEYWSARMRDAVDTWVESGGHVARFAGNFGWQVRLENEGQIQVCYKELAQKADPVAGTADSKLTTTLWDDPLLERPGSLTFGLQTVHGIYARVGAAVPRGSGGFTVYRPEHWAFRDADLYYGDSFGSTARIFGFEMDGLDYEFRDGLPFPKPSSAIPPGLEILAMNVTSPVEANHGHPSTKLFIGEAALEGFSQVRYGTTSADRLEAARRGSGMIVSFKKGAGEVFHAGASEWVNGLRLREPFTEAITRTVIRRMAGLDQVQCFFENSARSRGAL